MARAALQKVYADFRQGFVTVANPLAFPEGSLKDIVNFDIEDNGTVKLRPGLRLESVFTVDTTKSVDSLNNLAINAGIWNNVANSGEDRIAVVQVGQDIHLFDMLDSGINLENPIAKIDVGIPPSGGSKRISTASGAGLLFVAHPMISPVFIKRTSTNVFEVEPIEIQIRDLSVWAGSDEKGDGTAEEETGRVIKGTTLYPQHEYNLRNGGWPDETFCRTGNGTNDGATETDPVTYTFSKRGYYPQISLPFSAAKAGGGDTVTKQNAYNPWAFDTDYFGTGTAPVGRFIVNAASWSREGLGVTPLDASKPGSVEIKKEYEWTKYPSSIEFYSGRIWYTGVKGYQESVVPSEFQDLVAKDNLDTSNVLYFSQQIGSDLNKAGKCYQQNDPTAEDINQLLSTDGGTLAIEGAGEILDIQVFGTALIVFSNEGVWAVSGIDTNSFKADSFSVKKISNIGPVNSTAITATDKTIYYTADDAIYVLATDQVTGTPVPQDITSAKIKDFYTGLSSIQKTSAKTVFDSANRLFYFIYIDKDDPSETDFSLSYNRALIFNQDLNAFYKYSFDLTDKYLLDGLFYVKDNVVNIEENIVVDVTQVVVDAENVARIQKYSTESLSNIQFLTIVDNGLTGEVGFSSFTDINTLQDFGVDYTGYVEFGFDAAGDIMRDSVKTPVIISHMEKTEDGFEDDGTGELQLTKPSSCLLSYGWDWATSYKNQFQLYRFNRNYIPSGEEDTFNYGQSVITTRNRIRGKGYSLGIRLDSEAGKDCRVLGLGLLFTQAQRI